MQNSRKETPQYIVSYAILEKEGRFSLSDILESVQSRIINMFDSVEQLRAFIKRRLDELCDMGLVRQTEVYYFSV